VGGWRCSAVEKLSQVELGGGNWRTAPRSGEQTCIEQVEFDADAQTAEDPQNGQCGNWRSSSRAKIMRRVVME
jgi:hypothetical protein